jgi:type I restriction enzyme S subunit
VILPRGWTIKPAQEICEKIQDGTHFSPKNQFSSGLYPYVTAKNVRPWGLDLDNLTYLEEKEHRPIYERSDTRKGDVLLVKDGVNAGDAAINTIEGEISLLSSVCFLRPKKILRSKFLRYYLQSPQCQAELLGNLSGSAIRRIILRKIRELPIIVAPLEEQDAIITELDIQLSRLDEAVNTLQGIQAKLKQARASILKAAVEGRLVETEAEIARREKTDYESGGLLLERILYLRENSFRIARQSLNNKIKYPRAFTPSQAKTNVLPEGWAIATIDQLTNYFNGSFIVQGWSPKCLSREAYSSEWCVMKTTAIQPLRFDSGSNKALPQGLDPRPDLELTSGDLLITRAGPRSRVGICCLIEKTRSKVMLCDKAYRIRPSRLCLGKYLEIALNSQSASHSIEQIKTGINDSGVNITQSGFLNLLIPLPPLSEQNRIVDEVDRRFSVLVQVEATVQTSLARCGLLRQAILKRAFGG